MAISEIRRLEQKIKRERRLIKKLIDLRDALELSADEMVRFGAKCRVLDAELARAVRRDDGIRATELIAELKPLLAERDARQKAERRINARMARVIAKLRQEKEV
jgi:hypothetical protein